jgi:methylthioribose-1-phosphate isomerase
MTTAISAAADISDKQALALQEAERIADEEADNCRRIGEHGLALIEAAAMKKPGAAVNILTHCNAGWLACVEYGTATAPMYAAAHRGIDIHVWVDETRPLNQGARLTAWELGRAGIPHTLITDNAGGHLMQHGMVDMVIVGTDRTTHTGDVANKIGTYLKALAAKDNGIPFYVALPGSTFDWELTDGLGQIPIEERDPDEVKRIQGLEGGKTKSVLICPEETPAANYAFDVTPARLVTGFITERGVCEASKEGVMGLFPDKR